MRRARLMAMLFVAACTSSSSLGTADYSYAGCPEADVYCPGDLTLACALKSIGQTYNVCAGDSDCVLAPLDPMCSGEGVCPPFVVNDAGAASFRGLAQAEINRYCAEAGCSTDVLCAPLAFQAICDAGRCGFWINPDGGFWGYP